MSADDQQFWDLLSSVPNHVRQYSGDVAGYVDQAVDKAAEAIRETMASTPWLPEYARPNIPPPPPVQVIPVSAWGRTQAWISRNKLISGVLVCIVGYATYRSVRHSKLLRKSRRARRARNGGRLEVVVIAGSPSLPLTKSLSLDLERRGFIVYVTCNTTEDELMVQSLSRPDIKGLPIDITNPLSAGTSIERFASYLQTQHAAVPRAKPSYLTLTSVILIPSLHYQTSPIATIPPSNFADLFNTHLLQPILTIQAFLPLLTSRLALPPLPHTGNDDGDNDGSSKNSNENSENNDRRGTKAPRVLVFTPSIISSINPPFHAPEATVCSALSAFTEVLTGELRPLGVPVTQFRLGTFDFTGFVPARNPHNTGSLPPSVETQQWPEAARLAYARNFEIQSSSAISAGRIRGLKGSSLRDLHHAVFDVIDGTEKSDVVRVGLGAGLYGFVGRWVPRGIVAWMMGIRRVNELSTWEGSYSGSGSERSNSENGEGHEYIAVGRVDDGATNVWKEV
ncbi:DUF1776-domain-containing protein [Poronia punctata]|nr:DUF1776-domain-containing protein [Poronia punctata]